MRTKLTLLIALVALVAAGAALADSPKRTAAPFGIHYAFVGRLTAVPANGGVSVDVGGGNRPALRAMLGQPVAQTFATGPNTEFLRWEKGVPTVVQSDDLAVGEYVRVNVRAPRGASLADIEESPSPLVGDHGTQLYRPTQPLYLFRAASSARSTARASRSTSAAATPARCGCCSASRRRSRSRPATRRSSCSGGGRCRR